VAYLHGFRSSPRSVKAQLFARAVAALPASRRPHFHLPDLQGDPVAAVARVAAWIEREAPCAASEITLVGSSLGGYFATHLAERFGVRAALINPAFRPYDDLRAHGADEAGEAYLDALLALKVSRITRPERYFLLVRTGDEILDWRESIAFYRGAWQHVAGGGDHGWTDFGAELPAVLRFAGVGE
jgi:predicted esterase YcpF (UPF0227 family)